MPYAQHYIQAVCLAIFSRLLYMFVRSGLATCEPIKIVAIMDYVPFVAAQSLSVAVPDL